MNGGTKAPMLRRGQTDSEKTVAPAHQAEEDEVVLVRRVAGGDMRAFEQLYRRYFTRIARFVDRMTHGAVSTDEAVNDTLLVVWNRADSFNGTSKVSTWIFAIAYRKALKALASRRAEEEVEEPGSEQDDADPAPGPEQQAQALQEGAALRAAMGRLPADQRAVIELAYFQGMGVREIAGIVGCPPDTVKTRMFHARRKLRQWLGQE